MAKYLFLIPLYNDWRSLNFLLKKINAEVSKKKRIAEVIILNDASETKKTLSKKSLSSLKKINIINLKENLGSQKAISIGLEYISNLKTKSTIIVMDSDGEDDPSQINLMIDKAKKFPNHIIVSNRTKRKEILIFRILYKIHLMLTFIFTGKWISFGNYSAFNIKNLQKLKKNNSTWYALSSGIIHNCDTKNVYAERKERFFDSSKVSFPSLFFHSLRVISVFQKRVLLSSILYAFILNFFYINFENNLALLLIFFVILLNISIAITKSILKLKDFENKLDFIDNVNKVK